MSDRQSSSKSQSLQDLKQQFQERYKYKIRAKASDLGKKKDGGNLTDRQGYSLPSNNLKDSSLSNFPHSQLAQTIKDVNFQHHCDEGCLCKQCLCGRHTCKLNVIKPDFKKASVYQKSFVGTKGAAVEKIFAKESEPLKAPHLDLRSIYLKDFNKRNGDQLERPAPKDSVAFEGPMINLTTYGSFFAAHRGQNQYPTDNHTRGQFPLFGQTSYKKQFNAKKLGRQDSGKHADHLKFGEKWMNNSTYQKFYQHPNPEDYSRKVKVLQKLQHKPQFNHQYETIYKNDFLEKQTQICPSKRLLENTFKSKQFANSKHLFRQNSDYKAMSPNFHAIATSKHFYV